ncbi:hypothetical protein JHK87_004126 [Glycine soja]|nr:hypothetical protein JHK87_004126 [Glycine soja]
MIKGYSAVSRLGEATSIWDVDSLVCAGLSSRLQEYKSAGIRSEPLMLEGTTKLPWNFSHHPATSGTFFTLVLLGLKYCSCQFRGNLQKFQMGFQLLEDRIYRELSKSYEASITQLQKDLYESKREMTRVESNMVEALAAKNAEIEALVSSMDVVKSQAAMSQGNLVSLQALREEVESVERRAEEKRAAYIATKMVAMERKVELEHGAVESSTALARIQLISGWLEHFWAAMWTGHIAFGILVGIEKYF